MVVGQGTARVVGWEGVVPPGGVVAVMGTAWGVEGKGEVPPGVVWGGQNIDIARNERRLSFVILRRSDRSRTTDQRIL